MTDALSQSATVLASRHPREARSFGVSLSPSMALEVVETVKDRALIMRQTHRLAYFTDGDYRASRAWVRVVDWMVLLLLAGLERLWMPNDPGRALAAGLSQVAVLLVAICIIEMAAPFLAEYEWKRFGKMGILFLSALAVGLNTVAALDQHPAMRLRYGEQLQVTAVMLTYVVGIGSIGCIVLLFGLFWWTLL